RTKEGYEQEARGCAILRNFGKEGRGRGRTSALIAVCYYYYLYSDSPRIKESMEPLQSSRVIAVPSCPSQQFSAQRAIPPRSSPAPRNSRRSTPPNKLELWSQWESTFCLPVSASGVGFSIVAAFTFRWAHSSYQGLSQEAHRDSKKDWAAWTIYLSVLIYVVVILCNEFFSLRHSCTSALRILRGIGKGIRFKKASSFSSLLPSPPPSPSSSSSSSTRVLDHDPLLLLSLHVPSSDNRPDLINVVQNCSGDIVEEYLERNRDKRKILVGIVLMKGVEGGEDEAKRALAILNSLSTTLLLEAARVSTGNDQRKLSPISPFAPFSPSHPSVPSAFFPLLNTS
ncbi:hypothetical protein F5880DRAFT_1635839, partial [Lentinula raphanica]